MSTINRREFLSKTTKAAMTVGAASTFSINVLGANEKVVVGVMGIKGRGSFLAPTFAERKDVVLKYLADPDSRLFGSRSKDVEKACGKAPECVQDYRKILDDKEVEALVNSTPNHWHALPTIQACQVGKDVYVEKPTCHNIWEGRRMVEAAKKYKRIVQVGTQTRSGEYARQAKEFVHSADFGDIHFVRVLNSKVRGTIGKEADCDPPEGVNYDLWLGPAPKRPFNPNRFHYAWNWFWDYGAGDLTNDGIHQLDIARYLAGVTCPKSVYSTGGNHFFNDDQETPDTQVVNWDFEKLTMAFEEVIWAPYMRKSPLEARGLNVVPNWPFNGTRVEIYGTKQFMFFGRHGDGWQAFGSENDNAVPLRFQQGQFPQKEHIANFIDCIRTRNAPNAPIEEGHLSTSMAHYGNASYRLGRKLFIDSATETFVKDDEANALIKRIGREPYRIPETV